MSKLDSLSKQRSSLSPTKRALLEKWMGGHRKALNIIPQRPQQSHYPLSFAQVGVWFLDQLQPNNPFYNLPAAFRIAGSLNALALSHSLNEIVKRHEILRTTFTTVEGQPVELIAPSLTLTLPLVDLQQIPEMKRQAEVQRLSIEEARQPFNLTTLPLLRAKLLRLGEAEHILLLCMHHIITDAWSMGVLLQELASVYKAFCDRLSPQLPKLPIQYADFAIWQREWLQGEVLESQLAYWKQQLNNIPLLELPTDFPRPAIQTYQGATQSFVLSSTLSKSLKELSHQEGATLFMTLLAIFQILLHYYSSQDDIVVGTDIANRNQADIEGLIGFFINQLVLYTNLSGNPTFKNLLERVRKVTLEAYDHQDLPFNLLVDAVKPNRDLSRAPLFQVKFVLQKAPITLQFSDLTLSFVEVDNGTAKFDLLLDIVELERGFYVSFQYNTDLFKADTITRLMEHFETLIQNIVAQPNTTLNVLEEILAKIDKQKQLEKEKELEAVIIHKLKKVKRKMIANY